MYYCLYYGEVVELFEDYDKSVEKALSLRCDQIFKNDLVVINIKPA